MEKKNVPKIRFPGFTEPWEQRKLGELSKSFEYGLNASAKEFDGKNKYIRITDIDEESHNFMTDDLTSPNINLLNADKIYIFESEKSVLQAHTIGYYSCLALGGNALSDYQIKNILKLNPKEIILGFDEGLDNEIIQQRINNIKSYLVLRECKIGIIHDINNKYIEKGSKCSPTDMGKEVFEKLIQECIYYK